MRIARWDIGSSDDMCGHSGGGGCCSGWLGSDEEEGPFGMVELPPGLM